MDWEDNNTNHNTDNNNNTNNNDDEMLMQLVGRAVLVIGNQIDKDNSYYMTYYEEHCCTIIIIQKIVYGANLFDTENAYCKQNGYQLVENNDDANMSNNPDNGGNCDDAYDDASKKRSMLF